MSTTGPPPCRRCRSPLEAGDLRCATCGAVVPAGDLPPAAARAVVEVLRCTVCGAAARYDPSVRGARCAFCDSVTAVERIEDPLEQTRAWLPFTVGADAARAALRGWLKGLGWFRPGDLLEEARVESLRPLWWVAWVFDARATVTWTADSDHGAWRSAWAPHAGRAELHFDDVLVSASRGLADDETLALAPGYDLGTARAEPSGVEREQATVEEFDVQRSQARARVLAAIERVAAQEVEGRLCPGSSHREVHVATLLCGLDTRRLAFPAWVLAYRYRGRLYRVVIGGQDARRVEGRAPVSVARVLLAAAAGLLLLAGALALVAAIVSGA